MIRELQMIRAYRSMNVERVFNLLKMLPGVAITMYADHDAGHGQSTRMQIPHLFSIFANNSKLSPSAKSRRH